MLWDKFDEGMDVLAHNICTRPWRRMKDDGSMYHRQGFYLEEMAASIETNTLKVLKRAPFTQ
jgi:hypothetical protein